MIECQSLASRYQINDGKHTCNKLPPLIYSDLSKNNFEDLLEKECNHHTQSGAYYHTRFGCTVLDGGVGEQAPREVSLVCLNVHGASSSPSFLIKRIQAQVPPVTLTRGAALYQPS